MSQSNSFNGVLVAGRLVGIRADERRGKDGQPWIRHFLGIETEVVGGFPGQKDITEIQVSEANNNAALHSALDKYKGKDVFVRVYVRAFATRAGAGMQFNLSSDENNIIAQPQHHVKAA